MANITGSIPEINYEKKPISQEQLQYEVDYVRAQMMLDSMVQNGLISLSEFNKITYNENHLERGGFLYFSFLKNVM